MKRKKKIQRSWESWQVAVFGSGVSRVYWRIVRYNFRIGTVLPFFPLLTDLFLVRIIWDFTIRALYYFGGFFNQCFGPMGCILVALIYAISNKNGLFNHSSRLHCKQMVRPDHGLWIEESKAHKKWTCLTFLIWEYGSEVYIWVSDINRRWITYVSAILILNYIRNPWRGQRNSLVHVDSKGRVR